MKSFLLVVCSHKIGCSHQICKEWPTIWKENKIRKQFFPIFLSVLLINLKTNFESLFFSSKRDSFLKIFNLPLYQKWNLLNQWKIPQLIFQSDRQLNLKDKWVGVSMLAPSSIGFCINKHVFTTLVCADVKLFTFSKVC